MSIAASMSNENRRRMPLLDDKKMPIVFTERILYK
jgi:hypothetical protein